MAGVVNNDRAGARPPSVFLSTVVMLVVTYFALRFGLPRFGVWMGMSEHPAPVPRFAMVIYMTCAVFGALVYVSSEDRRWHLFLEPVVRSLVLARGNGFRLRMFMLALPPLVVGWFVWNRVMPSTDVPTMIRLQHPTQPAQYAALENPFRALPTEERGAIVREGMVLYQKNCRPCHGTVTEGNGPLARGLRLRPVDFSDPGTIASVVESYPFWRIREGHAGLPDIATPWNSAMPAWGDHLSDEDIWKIIMAEYLIAGTDPRIPERIGG